MVREGIPMLKVLEVLKERYGEKVGSIRKIASSLGISRPTVRKYLDLAASVGICHWPLREDEAEKSRPRSRGFVRPSIRRGKERAGRDL